MEYGPPQSYPEPHPLPVVHQFSHHQPADQYWNQAWATPRMSGPHQHPGPPWDPFPDGRTLFSDSQPVWSGSGPCPEQQTLQNSPPEQGPVGVLENIENCDTHEINPKFINAQVQSRVPQTHPLTADERKFIVETISLMVPESY